MSLELVDSVANIFEVPVATLFIDQFSKQESCFPEIRAIEIQTIEQQLQKTLAENVKNAFERIKAHSLN